MMKMWVSTGFRWHLLRLLEGPELRHAFWLRIQHPEQGMKLILLLGLFFMSLFRFVSFLSKKSPKTFTYPTKDGLVKFI